MFILKSIVQKNMHSVHPVSYEEKTTEVSVLDIRKFLSKRGNDDQLIIGYALIDDVIMLSTYLHRCGYHSSEIGFDTSFSMAKVATGAPMTSYYGNRRKQCVHEILAHTVSFIRLTKAPYWRIEIRTIFQLKSLYPTLSL